MAQNNREYQGDRLKHLFAKVVKSPLSVAAVAITTVVGVPMYTSDWMGGDYDRTGGENRDVFYAEMRAEANTLSDQLREYQGEIDAYKAEKKSLQTQIDLYNQLEKEGTYSNDNALKKVALMTERDALSYAAPEGLRDDLREFMADLLTTGTDEAPTLSEKDIQTLLDDVNVAHFGTVQDLAGVKIAHMLMQGSNMEHFDAAYQDNLPIAKDVESRLDAAEDMMDSAKRRDIGGTLAFIASLPGGAMLAWFLGFMLLGVGEENKTINRWAKKKPNKPKPH